MKSINDMFSAVRGAVARPFAARKRKKYIAHVQRLLDDAVIVAANAREVAAFLQRPAFESLPLYDALTDAAHATCAQALKNMNEYSAELERIAPKKAA